MANRRRAHKKQAPKPKAAQTSQPKPSTSNKFGALADQSETQMNFSEPEPKNNDNPKKGGSTLSPTDTHGKEASTSDKQKDILWSTQGKQLEIPTAAIGTEEEPIEEQDYSQFMDEETDTIDIGDLDLPSLEKAFTTNNFDNIPAGQLKNLEEVLSRAQRQKSLGIQTGSPWDRRLIAKDIKKRGRKTILQRTIKVGQILVDSGRYAKLTKYFSPEINLSQ